MNLFKILFFLFIFFLPGVNPFLAAQSDNNLKNNIDLYNNKLYSLAHLKFLTLIENSLSMNVREEAYYYAGLCSFYSGNFHSAISELDSLLIDFPNTRYFRQVKKYSALSYFYSENYVAALTCFNNYVKEFPKDNEDPLIYFYMAQSYSYMGYYDKALKYLTVYEGDSVLEEPDKSRVMFLTAQNYFYEKKYDEALKIFNKIIGGGGSRLLKNYASFFRGIISFSLDNKEEAVKIFRAIKEKRDIDKNLIAISDLFVRVYNNDLTKEFFEEFIKGLEPDDKNKELFNFAYLNMSELYIQEQKFDEAESIIKSGLKLGLMKDYYYRLLAKIDIYRNDLSGAGSYLNKITEGFPDSVFFAESVYNSGVIKFLEEDYVRSTEYFERLASGNSDEGLKILSLFKLGEIKYLNNDLPKAKEYFLQALDQPFKQDFVLKKIVFYLSEIYAYTGRDNDNISLLEKYNKEFKDFSLDYKLALSYYNIKKYKECANIIKGILENSSSAGLNYRSFLLLMKVSENLPGAGDLNKYLLKFKNNRYITEKDYTGLLIKICLINIKNENYKEAEEDLVYALTLNPDWEQKKSIYYNLYRSYESLNQGEKAVRSMDKLINLEDNKEIKINYLYLKAQLYKKLNTGSKYKETLREILKYTDFSNNEYYKKAEQELRN